MKSLLFRRFFAAVVTGGVAMLSIAFCPNARAGDADPQWTCGSWTTFTAAENNVFLGLNGQLTNGSGADQVHIGNDAVQTYKLRAPANITEIRIYNNWDAGREELHVNSVVFTDADGAVTRVDVPGNHKSGTAKTYGFLRRPDGLPLCLKAIEVVINFGKQQNDWCGCAEIEAVAAPDSALCDALEIATATPGFGAPEPGYGITNGLAVGTSVPMSMDPSAAVVEIEDGVRCVCTGWKVYRCDLAKGVFALADESGEDDKYAFTYVQGATMGRVVWQWERQCRVTVTAGDGGSVSPVVPVWVPSGSSVTVTATAGEGNRFAAWSGDVPPARALDASFSLPVTNKPAALVAAFRGAAEGIREVTTASELAAALSAAAAGDEIVLKRTEENGGVFALTATVTLDKPVTLRGETGDPADIVLDAGGNKRAMRISDAALVKDLTVCNGSISGGDQKGAGVYMTAGTLRNCIVRDNKLPSGQRCCGAGICLEGSDTLVEDCEVRNNTGDMQTYGAGVHNNNGTVRRTVIHGNKNSRSITWGTGYYQKGADALMEYCVVSNHVNTGIWGGADRRIAGAYVTGGRVYATLFSGNKLSTSDASDTSNSSAAIMLGKATVANCLFIDNASSSRKDCACVGIEDSAAIIENCVFYNNINSVMRAEDDVKSGSNCIWRNNAQPDLTVPTCGSGCVLLGNPPFKVGTYEIPDGSPRIGAGFVDSWMANAKDLKGIPLVRVEDGIPVVDIGPYAYVRPPISVAIGSDTDALILGTMDVTLESVVEGETDGLTYYWDFDGDGTADRIGGDLGTINLQETRFGDYAPRLYVTNAVGLGAVSEIGAVFFKFRPSTVHVRAGSEGSAWPYASAETAAASIGEALSRDNLQDGMTVICHRAADAEGPTVYAVSETLVLDKPVTVRGETGDPKDIVLDGGSARRVVKVDHVDAVLSSVTVSNGKLTPNSSYGAGIYLDRGTVTNCIVTGCVLSGQNTYGSGVYLATKDAVLADCEITACKGGLVAYGCGVNNVGGKVIRCRIHGNLVGNDIYSGIGLRQSGSTALAEDCIVTNNTYNGGRKDNPRIAGVALYGGEMRNSLVANNGIGTTSAHEAQPSAGGVYVDAARLVSCTVADNFSRNQYDCAGITVTANATIENCHIVRNMNKVTNAEDDTRTAAKGTWLSTVIQGATDIVTGSGNHEPDDVPFKDGTYDLPDGSACNGIGVVETWMENATDLAGRARLRTNAQGEPLVDAGCYAYVEPDLATPIFSEDDRLQFDGFSATIRCEPVGDTEGLVYYWDTDGDGTADRIGSDLSEIIVATNVFGVIPVKLYATNAVSGASAESATITFTHISRTVYIDDDSATSAWPYATPATAAAKFTDAVEVANLSDGITVKVAPGTYSVTKESWFKTQVTVEGTGASRDDATIVGTKSFRIIRLQKAGSVLRNLTISRGSVPGSDEDAGGGGIRAESGTLVENCKVTDCGGGRPCYGPGICCIGATVRDCHVTGTTVGGSSGESGAAIVYGAGIYVNGAAALVERCLVEDCTVTGCHCRNGHDQGTGIEIQGGVVRACLIRNCTLLRADTISGFNDDAIRAAGVHLKGGKLVNCTVLNCTANFGGTGGVCAKGGKVENCLIWDNTRNETAGGEQVASNWDSKYNANYTYCCTTPALADVNSTTADPMFRHPALLDGIISSASPCAAGAGFYDTAALDAAALDLYGTKLVTSSGKAPIGCVAVSAKALILTVR